MKKKYWEMTSQELAEATKHFDEPMVVEQSRPLTSAERQQWRKAKRKPGRPRLGQGFQRISLSIEKGLLKRANSLARKRQISRSLLFAQVLEHELAKEM